MPGGEIQLSAQGAQDLYLTGDPKMSFFKSVYVRYTYFATQLISLDDDNTSNTLNSYDQPMTMSFRIPRNADLIKDVYVQFQLPNIYSSSEKQFQWIRRIGEYLILEARVVGGDSRVYNRIRCELLHIHAETNISADKKTQYYRDIGHIPELYDPANAPQSGGIYPDRPKPANGDTGIPSISAYTLTVRIPFWFGTSGTALPLIALQRMDFRVELDIRPLNQCFTVIDTNPLSPTFQTRIRPVVSTDFLSTFAPAAIGDALPNSSVRAWGNYVFLDREERKRFALTEHTYLMRQYQYYNNETSDDYNGVYNLDLRNINHPITQFWFFARRRDNELSNQWSNYSLWEWNSDLLENPLAPNGFWSEYNNQFVLASTTQGVPQSLQTPDPITNAELIFNSSSRFDRTGIEFFRINRAQYNASDSSQELSGVYCYSFALDNYKYQPSGTANFSRIGKKELRITFKDLNNLVSAQGFPYTRSYRVMLIAENINFFRIISGLAGEEFSN
jgi:hypothetical protein